MSSRKDDDGRVGSALDAGTRLLGINVTQVARWVGPVVLTFWAGAWVVSHGDAGLNLPKGVSPLELARILLDWCGVSGRGVEDLQQWIAARGGALGPISVLAAAMGVSARHNIAVVVPLLLAVEAIGAIPAYLSLMLLTALIAAAAAIFTEVELAHSGRLTVLDKLQEAASGWFAAVVVSVVLLPGLVALMLCRVLMDRYVRGDDALYTSADQLNDELARQVSDPSIKIGDLPAGEALRALAVVMASTRDEERSTEILRFGRALRRKEPTGATSLPGFVERYRGPGPE